MNDGRRRKPILMHDLSNLWTQREINSTKSSFSSPLSEEQNPYLQSWKWNNCTL